MTQIDWWMYKSSILNRKTKLTKETILFFTWGLTIERAWKKQAELEHTHPGQAAVHICVQRRTNMKCINVNTAAAQSCDIVCWTPGAGTPEKDAVWNSSRSKQEAHIINTHITCVIHQTNIKAALLTSHLFWFPAGIRQTRCSFVWIL